MSDTDFDSDAAVGSYELPPDEDYPVIKLGKRTVPVKDILRIDPENLVEAYQTVHHWIAVIGNKMSGLTLLISSLKRELGRLEAGVSRTARNMEKKPTEAAIKDMVTLDKGVIQKQEEIAAAERQRHKFSIFLEALNNKRDLVINMGAELRKRRDRDIM